MVSKNSMVVPDKSLPRISREQVIHVIIDTYSSPRLVVDAREK